MKNPSLYLDRAVLYLNSRSYRSIRLTYRDYTARRPEPGVYAELVCGKCGEGITQGRLPHVDTSTTPVCHLTPLYLHSLIVVPL